MHVPYSYLDGQKIAKRLILKETKKIKALLLDYNICSFEVEISTKEAFDPVLSSKLESTLKSKVV